MYSSLYLEEVIRNMDQPKYTKILLYGGMVLFLVSLIASLLDYDELVFYEVIRALVFLIALWYLVWHFYITKGHRAAYDRIAEGTILLMVIYNPFKPFILDVFVWQFLDIVFLWVFWLYILEVRDIQKKIDEGVRNWSNTGEEIL